MYSVQCTTGPGHTGGNITVNNSEYCNLNTLSLVTSGIFHFLLQYNNTQKLISLYNTMAIYKCSTDFCCLLWFCLWFYIHIYLYFCILTIQCFFACQYLKCFSIYFSLSLSSSADVHHSSPITLIIIKCIIMYMCVYI